MLTRIKDDTTLNLVLGKLDQKIPIQEYRNCHNSPKFKRMNNDLPEIIIEPVFLYTIAIKL